MRSPFAMSSIYRREKVETDPTFLLTNNIAETILFVSRNKLVRKTKLEFRNPAENVSIY